MVRVAPGSSGPHPRDVVPAGSPCSPGPMTHFVQGWIRASVRRLGDGWNGERKTVWLSGVGQRSTSSLTRVVARLVTLMVRWPVPVPGTVGCTLTRMRRASRVVGRASESGGSALGVGVADGWTLGDAVVVGDDCDAVGVGVALANGPTHPTSRVTLSSATPVIPRVRRRICLPSGIDRPRSHRGDVNLALRAGMVREGESRRGRPG